MYDEDYDHEDDRACSHCEEYETDLEEIETHYIKLFAQMKLKGLLDDDAIFDELESIATILKVKIEV